MLRSRVDCRSRVEQPGFNAIKDTLSLPRCVTVLMTRPFVWISEAPVGVVARTIICS
ncbi:hypothetical protein Plhal304r1_c020g0071741 [Plasmopara halstedii]